MREVYPTQRSAPLMSHFHRAPRALKLLATVPRSATGAGQGETKVKTCDQPTGASASIALVGAPSVLILMPTLKGQETVVALGHLFARNEGIVPLSGWCVTP